MDDRIGKHGKGGFRPKQTITGRPLSKNAQIFITRNLDDDYYVVVDPGVIPELEALIEDVKRGLPNEPKRKHRVNTATSEENNSM